MFEYHVRNQGDHDDDRQGRAARQIPDGARQTGAPRRQRSVPAGRRANSRTTSRIPYTPFDGAKPKTDHVTFAFIGGGFAGSSPARGWSRPASPTSASSRKAATSAAPGTGTGIPAPNATPHRWSTCRCSRRPATCRPRNMRTRRRSSSNASASATQFGLYDNALFQPR